MLEAPARIWALKVYRRSVLKQQKHRAIQSMLGDVGGKRCLDVGGDNGVISLLLRELGGEWHSADLDERTVTAIRALVQERVEQIVDGRLPYPTGHFDLIAIVDLLEHLEDDRGFVAECARLLRPGGILVANVPHVKRRSVLTRLRHALGLTDEKHGHVRPGYTLETLRSVLEPHFALQEARTYCRSCSELIDIVLNAGYERRVSARAQPRSRKGTVITQAELSHQPGGMRILSVLYPLLKVFSACDALLRWQAGYRLIVRATARREAVEQATAPARTATSATL